MMRIEAELLIENCRILDETLSVIENGCIAIKDGTITHVGALRKAPKFTAESVLDGSGKLAMPGLINCHTHLAMTLFRGLAEEMSLTKWLSEAIWPLEAKLRSEDVSAGALLGCVEMIKSGTTCFADMYFFESRVADAVQEAGLRAVLSSGIIEGEEQGRGEQMFKESLKFALDYQGYAGGRVLTCLGPHTAYTCGPDLLMKIRNMASQYNIGLHIHLAELQEWGQSLLGESGLSEVATLDKMGFLGADVLGAHCIHLTPEDIAILRKRGVKVAHNPIANMKLAQGITKVDELIREGVTVGLGTDGAASNNSLDMFETMKVAALLQKIARQDPTVLSSRQVLEMATNKGAETLRLSDSIGSIEEGKKADIILIDLKRPGLTPLHDVCANIVYSARGSDVDTMIVDGKILMEAREVKTVDEGEIMLTAQETAQNLLER